MRYADIERKEEKKPFQMSAEQLDRARELIKRECANYNGGNCLLLDRGEPVQCPQMTSYTPLCKYFRHAVLPLVPDLETDIFGGGVKCRKCGAVFKPKSPRQKYCEECGKHAARERTAARVRKSREKCNGFRAEKALN